MKYFSIATFLGIVLTATIKFFGLKDGDSALQTMSYQQYLAGKIAIGCGSGVAGAAFDWRNDEPSIPLLKGWGNFEWPITAANDSARIYFNQGINMYYSFHMIEAKASFAKAARFDPDCAMAFWGLAMAYGVNYNYAMLKNAPEAMDAMANAIAAINNESAFEKALVATLKSRYNADTAVSRMQQNVDYEKAIGNVLKLYPDDANVNALYADALMVQHPWDMYDIKGMPKTWTPAIVEVLETALKKHQSHPSLNHLYIHAMEGGTKASDALPSAWRLSTMMPSVSHMVHMPSHIFIRTGHYKEGILVNDSSINGYNDYYARFPAVEGDAFLYVLHNLHMKAACTMYRANATEAIAAAKALQMEVPSKYMESADGMGNYLQYMYSTPVLAQVRFGLWDTLLASPRISASLKNAWAIQSFGLGMAWAKKGNVAKAKAMLHDLKNLVNDATLKAQFESINPASKTLDVMIALLEGTIEMESKNWERAIAAFTIAVKAEDALSYQEPRDWLLPARHFLGDVLLKQNKWKQAMEVYEQELIINPSNVWSLYGLLAAQKAAGKKEQHKTAEVFSKANTGADVTIGGSVF